MAEEHITFSRITVGYDGGNSQEWQRTLPPITFDKPAVTGRELQLKIFEQLKKFGFLGEVSDMSLSCGMQENNIITKDKAEGYYKCRGAWHKNFIRVLPVPLVTREEAAKKGILGVNAKAIIEDSKVRNQLATEKLEKVEKDLKQYWEQYPNQKPNYIVTEPALIRQLDEAALQKEQEEKAEREKNNRIWEANTPLPEVKKIKNYTAIGGHFWKPNQPELEEKLKKINLEKSRDSNSTPAPAPM